MTQLALDFDAAPPPPPAVDGPEWMTAVRLPWEGCYVPLIRHPDDPERMSREERRALLGGHAAVTASWSQMAKRSPSTWRGPLLEALDARGPSTMNALAVALTGTTADVVFLSPFHRALVELVAEGVVECTNTAPIFWRLIFWRLTEES